MCISGGVTSTAAIFSEAFEAVEHIAGHLAVYDTGFDTLGTAFGRLDIICPRRAEL